VRWLFWILLILGLAVGISLLAVNNQGYVLIVRPPYRMELSLNLLLVMILGGFISLHLLLRLIQYTRHLPASVRSYKEERRIRLGRAALSEGLQSLAEGRYLLAEKAANKALALEENPGLSTLVAARAAHKLKNKSQRDFYLAEAERIAPDAAVARLLYQAEFMLDDRRYNEALNVLHKLDKLESKYPPALRLELKAQVHLKNWEQVLVTLRRLEKHDAIESWHLRELRQQAHTHLLQRLADDLDKLNAYWKKMPEEDRLNNRIACIAAQTFIQAGAGDQAAEIVEMSLTKGWDSKLAGMLGDCLSSQPQKQLQQAEHWLLSHENDADLLRSLGNLCVRLSLWGKAQSYFEASLSVKPSAATHLALARLLDERGETEAANHQFRLSTQFCPGFE
jgi:HemY protein